MRTWWSGATAVLVATGLGAAPAAGQSSGRPDGLRFVPPTAEHAIRQTMQAPDALGFHMDGTPDPTTCKHYQGMVRVDGTDGTPFFIVSRSGNFPDLPSEAEELGCAGDVDNGAIVVVRMLSRPKHRERLRSNRLSVQTLIRDTAPPPNDRAIAFFTVVGGDPGHPDPARRPGLIRGHVDGMPERIYQHPGGMALVGNILAVAMEHPRQGGTIPPTAIMFFDVSNPEEPVFTSQYTPVDSLGYPRHSAGVVAVTPLASGRYLMLVSGGQNEQWLFYRSTLTDLSSPNLSWEYVGLLVGPDGITDPHQTFAFLRQGSITGPLYLAGARGHPIRGDRDRIDLYRIACDTSAACTPGEPIFRQTIWNGRRIVPAASSGEPGRLANLAAASAFHLTPSGELLFYATTHDNDGPDGTVEMGEWRNIDVVRDGSPTLLPSLTIDGPATVNEGSSLNLRGQARFSVTRPFMQLFADRDFLGTSVIADLDDFTREVWNSLPPVAQSWNWFAPPGCVITVLDGEGRTHTLTGGGRIERKPDLALVINDAGTANMDRKVTEIRFDQDCRQFYNRPVWPRWDLDGDGQFDTIGNFVTFTTDAIDGPTVVPVMAEVDDGTNPTPRLFTSVTVRNVNPTLVGFRVSDSGGEAVNTTVPFVLVGLPIGVTATFRDPGRLDHQTATLSWGDGRVDAHGAFQTFDEAFGDGIGAVAHGHSYARPGTYRVTLRVTDDDAAVGAATTDVRVLAPDVAVVEIIALIDAAIATAPTPLALSSLQSARTALAGDVKGQNGALASIRARDYPAAIGFLNQANELLSMAVKSGANARAASLLVPQVTAALSILL